MKMLLSAGLAVHAIIGNFCMMPMAYGADAVRMNHEMGEMEQVMEMVMTPVHPMSSLHCDGCVTITRPRHHESPMRGGMPCNDGHCLAEHSSSTTTATQSSQKNILEIALRPAHFIIDVPEIINVALKPRNGPSTRIAQTRTVVLRE